MSPNNKGTRLITIVLLSVVFGLSAGVVGELLARAYLLDSALKIPFFGEINISNGDFSGPNVIIRDAENVIIEQDQQAIETIQLARDTIVGIFKKVKLPADNELTKSNTEDTSLSIENLFYNLEEEVGQGLIITSDGWIVTSFSPPELSPNLNSEEINKIIFDKYVVITHDNNIYPIDQMLRDQLTPFSFIHVSVKDFPVKRLAGLNEISNGQSVIAVNWEGQGMLSSIYDKHGTKKYPVSFSDEIETQILLSNSIAELFTGGFLFNLTGDAVALVDNQDNIYSISSIAPVINSILEHKTIKRASLGIHYISLSDHISAQILNNGSNQLNRGALIYNNDEDIAVIKNSAADLAGFMAGDIIISIDNYDINHDNQLNNLIQSSFIAGDEVSLVYIRNNQENDVKIKLGEIEQGK